MAGTQCCGKVRTSRFCPDCGQNLGGAIIFDLLKHCRTQEDRQRKQSRNQNYGSSHIAAAEKSAAKFKAWGDALAALLGQASTEENDGSEA